MEEIKIKKENTPKKEIIIAKKLKEEKELCPFDKVLKDYEEIFGKEELGLQNFLPVFLDNEKLYDFVNSVYADARGDEKARSISIFTLVIAHLIKIFLQKIMYIGPLREYPERYYILGDYTSGNSAPYILFKNPELLDKLNKYLSQFKINYKVVVSPLSDESAEVDDIFMLRLINNDSNVSSTIRDVGFGISQVLPIIVQSLVAEKQTLLIEQPELHLHPALQAELGDLFIESALGGRENLFIIETHSEHLILRIMKRIRQTHLTNLPDGIPKIKPEDVSLIYVEQIEGKSIVHEIPLNELGQLMKAVPGGFFEEGLREVMD